MHQEAAQCKFWDDDLNSLLKHSNECYLYNDDSVQLLALLYIDRCAKLKDKGDGSGSKNFTVGS